MKQHGAGSEQKVQVYSKYMLLVLEVCKLSSD